MSPHHPFSRAQEPRAQEPRVQDKADNAARGERSVGQDLDNIFRLTAPQAAPAAPERVRAAGAEPRRVTAPDLDAALDMLNRAAKAMDLLQSRYGQVEDYAKGVAERAEKDVAVAYAQAREWEVRAAGSETKLGEAHSRAEAAERRAEAMERRAEAAERRAEAAEAGAKEARDWLECFYDKIVTSFDTRNFLRSQAA